MLGGMHLPQAGTESAAVDELVRKGTRAVDVKEEPNQIGAHHN